MVVQPARGQAWLTPARKSPWEYLSDPHVRTPCGKLGIGPNGSICTREIRTLLFLKESPESLFLATPHSSLAPQRGTEPRVTAVKVLSPKPWTAGEPLRARGYTFSSTPLQEHLATAWPKSPSRFFRYILQKNLSELLGQPSTNGKDKRRSLF